MKLLSGGREAAMDRNDDIRTSKFVACDENVIMKMQDTIADMINIDKESQKKTALLEKNYSDLREVQHFYF